MKIDIYARHTGSNTYLAVESGNPVPQKLKHGFTFWKCVDLTSGAPRIGLDTEEVIADIQKQGWSAWSVDIRISEG
jgi:hypothetical protein